MWRALEGRNPWRGCVHFQAGVAEAQLRERSDWRVTDILSNRLHRDGLVNRAHAAPWRKHHRISTIPRHGAPRGSRRLRRGYRPTCIRSLPIRLLSTTHAIPLALARSLNLILLDLPQLAVWSYESFARRDLLVPEEKIRVQAKLRAKGLSGRSILSDCWRAPQGRSIQNRRVAPTLLHVSRAELLAHHEICAAGK